MKKRILIAVSAAVILGAGAWGVSRLVKTATAEARAEIPATRVKRGSVTITVAARGELQGGNSEMLTAPMIGGTDMAITYLREPGEVVEPGDMVVQFDTTTQEFNLREAQADLAEAEQQVIQAEATSEATDAETQYTLLSTGGDVKLAELEVKKNPTVPAIKARQNEIALEQAQNRLHQAQQDVANKKATMSAGVAIQKAAENKAKVTAETAQKNIDSMTLKAKTGGYVNVQQNTNMNMMFWGMQLMPFQLGDNARAGMAVAQIPDLKNWEVSANVGELDRGHLSVGQPVTVAVVALAGKAFAGHVKNLGGTTGSPWDRHFECRISLDKPGPELRPGMTSNMVITVETLENVTWVPSQALFESDGRTYVYRQTPNGFMPHDVTLVRRSESQAVLTGIPEGALVAMSNPDQQNKPANQKQGAMKALQQ
ncbi:MAG: HlyD family efflux transporter periplasmic adaptor subunit [Acidobacteriia bacterium]|nr:HlyD family efflux transporter periplasmic adaptor subunit [Terriglobia bacterium]